MIFDPAALVRTVPVLLILFIAGNLHDPWTYVGLALLVVFVAAAFTPLSVELRDDGINFSVEARRWPLPAQRAVVDATRVRGFALASYALKTWKISTDTQVRIDLLTEDGPRELLRGLPAKHRHLPELVARIDQFAREGHAVLAALATGATSPLAAAAPATNLLRPRG